MLSPQVSDFLHDIAQHATSEDVGNALLRLLQDEYDADTVNIWFWGQHGECFVSTYPEWFGPYIGEHLGNFHGRKHMKTRYDPIWYGLDMIRQDWPEDSKAEAQLAYESMRRRVTIGVPMHSNIGLSGAVSIGSRKPVDRFKRHFSANGSAMLLASHMAHQRMQKLFREGLAHRYRITARERECLLWISKGLQTGQVAEKLGVSEITIHLHIRKAKDKLGTKSRAETVAKAILLGLIVP